MAFPWDWGQQEGKKKKKSEVATCSNNFFSRPVFNSPLHLVEKGKLVPFSPLYLLLLYPFSHGAEALLVMDSSIILFFFFTLLSWHACAWRNTMAPFRTASHGKAPFLVLEKRFVYFPTLSNIKAPHYIIFLAKKKKDNLPNLFRVSAW